jgi:hypothetical protein
MMPPPASTPGSLKIAGMESSVEALSTATEDEDDEATGAVAPAPPPELPIMASGFSNISGFRPAAEHFIETTGIGTPTRNILKKGSVDDKIEDVDE